MTQIAVLGFGTVGSGVVEHFDINRAQIEKAVPGGISVKYILDIRDFPDSPYRDRVVHDYNVILNDPDIQVICETMGGVKPAYEFTKQALGKGISVCTSNKELVEKHGPELIALAGENNCSYLFEASVGGGIPIIRPLITALKQEYITSVRGILNGTTNYILTRMRKDGLSFDTVLKEAQENGFAERNPEADIEGYDACRKIAILSSLITGKSIHFEDVPCEGISKITTEDFEYAKALHRKIRLLGIFERDPETEEISVRTAPFMIPEEHPLASVLYVYNAIFVHGNLVNDLMFYGSGAGKTPTASAVVSDVVDAALHTGSHIDIRWDAETQHIKAPGEEVRKFFVRIGSEEKEKALLLFGDGCEEADSLKGEYGFITEEISESDFAEIISHLATLKNYIRILDI